MKPGRAELAVLFLLIVAVLAGGASALRAETLREMEAEVSIGAAGGFSGTVHGTDSMVVRFLTFRDFEGQEIEEIEEKMFIGGEVIEAEHEDLEGMRYAVFKVPDLKKYSSDPNFEISVKARIRRTEEIELGEDYGLGNGISGQAGFLLPSAHIESDSPELVSLAESGFTGSSEIETIRAVAEWVKANITYDMDYYRGTWSALETFRSRRGVCDEFANLTAAFMRIRGIPARYVSGVSFDGEEFGNHGWTEVFIPGSGWRGVDSTYGEAGYVDAAHFAIAKGPDANEMSSIVISTVSRDAIEIESRMMEPIVRIISSRQFEGVTRAGFEEKDLESEEEFEIGATVKNLRNANVIVPVQMLLHEDFESSGNDRLVWLKPGEEKTITFRGRAPVFDQEASYGRFGAVLLLPDGNVSGYLNVYPKGLAGAGQIVQYRLFDEAWLEPQNLAIFAFAVIGVPLIIIVLKRLLRRKSTGR